MVAPLPLHIIMQLFCFDETGYYAGFNRPTMLPKHSCYILLFSVNTTSELEIIVLSLYRSPQMVKRFVVGTSRAGSSRWWEEALSVSS